MSTMPGNPHASDAIRTDYHIGENWIAPEGMTDATGIATVIQANTEATLALAYEQRTANLIAQLNLRIRAIGKGIELQGDVVDELNARLGLDGGDA